MRNFKFYILFLILFFPLFVNAQEISSKFVCDKSSVNIGDTFSCGLSLTTSEDISSIMGNITYDSNYLSIVSISSTGNWNSYSNSSINVKTKDGEGKTLNKEKVAIVKFKAKSCPSSGVVSIKPLDNGDVTNINILSDDNYLSKLTVTGYSLSFNKNTLSYNLNVTSEKVNIDAKLNSSLSSFVSNYGPRIVTLKEGNNTLLIKVKSQSGEIRTYTLNINYQPIKKASNNNLKSLEVVGFDISPKFSSDTLEYTLKLNQDTKSIEIKATLDDTKASFNENNKPGKYEIKDDTKKIEIQVKAENGDIKTYKININKESNSLLISIKLSSGLIDFDSNVFEYTINVDNSVNTLDVDATAIISSSKIEIIKEEELKVGSNTIKINVTNGDSSSTYILYINRLSEEEKLSSNSLLSNIIIKNYNLNFDKEKYNYNLKIKNENKLDISVKKDNDSSLVVIKGNNKLKNGSKIFIYVTSEDGTKTTYTINIEKDNSLFYIIIIIISFIIFSTCIILLILNKKKKKNNPLGISDVDITLESSKKNKLIIGNSIKK